MFPVVGPSWNVSDLWPASHGDERLAVAALSLFVMWMLHGVLASLNFFRARPFGSVHRKSLRSWDGTAV